MGLRKTPLKGIQYPESAIVKGVLAIYQRAATVFRVIGKIPDNLKNSVYF